jgi:hypothetical protein
MRKCVVVTSTQIKMTEAIFQLLLEIQVVKKFSVLRSVGRSQWLCGLRRGSAAARLLELRVRIPPEAWIPVSFLVLFCAGRSLCVGLITHPEETYRLCVCMCVCVCVCVSLIVIRHKNSPLQLKWVGQTKKERVQWQVCYLCHKTSLFKHNFSIYWLPEY